MPKYNTHISISDHYYDNGKHTTKVKLTLPDSHRTHTPVPTRNIKHSSKPPFTSITSSVRKSKPGQRRLTPSDVDVTTFQGKPLPEVPIDGFLSNYYPIYKPRSERHVTPPCSKQDRPKAVVPNKIQQLSNMQSDIGNRRDGQYNAILSRLEAVSQSSLFTGTRTNSKPSSSKPKVSYLKRNNATQSSGPPSSSLSVQKIDLFTDGDVKWRSLDDDPTLLRSTRMDAGCYYRDPMDGRNIYTLVEEEAIKGNSPGQRDHDSLLSPYGAYRHSNTANALVALSPRLIKSPRTSRMSNAISNPRSDRLAVRDVERRVLASTSTSMGRDVCMRNPSASIVREIGVYSPSTAMETPRSGMGSATCIATSSNGMGSRNADMDSSNTGIPNDTSTSSSDLDSLINMDIPSIGMGSAVDTAGDLGVGCPSSSVVIPTNSMGNDIYMEGRKTPIHSPSTGINIDSGFITPSSDMSSLGSGFLTPSTDVGIPCTAIGRNTAGTRTSTDIVRDISLDSSSSGVSGHRSGVVTPIPDIDKVSFYSCNGCDSQEHSQEL